MNTSEDESRSCRFSVLEQRIDQHKDYLNIVVTAICGIMATAAICFGVYGYILKIDSNRELDGLKEERTDLKAMEKSLAVLEEELRSEIEDKLDTTAGTPRLRLLTTDGKALENSEVLVGLVSRDSPQALSISFDIRLENHGTSGTGELTYKVYTSTPLVAWFRRANGHNSSAPEFEYESILQYRDDMWRHTYGSIPGGGFSRLGSISFALDAPTSTQEVIGKHPVRLEVSSDKELLGSVDFTLNIDSKLTNIKER